MDHLSALASHLTVANLKQAPRAAVEWWLAMYEQNPTHIIVETVLVVLVLYVWLFKRAYDPAKKGYGARGLAGLSEREKAELIEEWTPEPLVSKPAPGAPVPLVAPNDFTIKSFAPGSKNVVVTLEGEDARPKVTFCTKDFLALGSSAAVTEAASSTLVEYSLGSCGPRGFYGTTQKHLELEDAIARFMGTPESITYSDELTTTASAIPAFAKRGDLLLVDAGASHAIITGAKLSRSKILMFKHNDTSDLETHLAAVAASDRKGPSSALTQRRFIVVEGLYANYGDIAPLPKIIQLARQYKWRIILDDTLGFGALGATGRGSTEHHGCAPTDVDVLIGSLSTTLTSVGGFCVGSREVVDHQRLSGAGYCFSASAPPFLCAVATAALKEMEANPGMLTKLHSRSTAVHDTLVATLRGARVLSVPVSPLKLIQLTLGDEAPAAAAAPAGGMGSPAPLNPPSPTALCSRFEEDAVLSAVVKRAAALGVCLTRTHYLPTEAGVPRPALKLYISLAHTEAQIADMTAAVARAIKETLDTLPSTRAAAAAGVVRGSLEVDAGASPKAAGGLRARK